MSGGRAAAPKRDAPIFPARAASFAFSGATSLALLVDPFLLRGVSETRVHSGLPILMYGAAGLFMHGLGYIPRTRWARAAFHPVLSWATFLLGAAVSFGVP